MDLPVTKFDAIKVTEVAPPRYVAVIHGEAKQVCDAMACLSALLTVHLPYSAQEKVDYALGVIDAFSKGEISYALAMEAIGAITADGEINCLCGDCNGYHVIPMAI